MGESLLSLGGCVCVFSSFHMEIIAGTDSSSSAGRGWDGSKSERRALLGLPPRRAGPGWKENRGGKWILGGMCPTRLTLLSPVAQGCPSGLALRAEGPGVHNQGESCGGTPSSSQIWQMGGRSIR